MWYFILFLIELIRYSTELLYETSYTFYLDVGINPKTPKINGYVHLYEISPPLSSGLSFDTLTGKISGIPSQTLSGMYTVSALNNQNSVIKTANINIQIVGINIYFY